MKGNGIHWTEYIIDFFDDITKTLTVFAITIGPWAAPIGPAFAVSRSLVRNLDFPISIACVAALAVEITGVGALNVTLAAFREKEKSQLRFCLGIISIFAYLSIGIVLTVGLGENRAVALFFLLAGISYLTQTLRIQHAAQAQYEREIVERDRLEEQRKKALRRVESALRRGLPMPEKDWRDAGFDRLPDIESVRRTVKPVVKKASGGVRQNYRQAVLDAVGDEYIGTMTQLAKNAGISRPTLYAHLDTLEREGIVSRDTNRVSRLTPG